LFSQLKNELEGITFYNETCEESLDAGPLRSQVMSIASLSVNSFTLST